MDPLTMQLILQAIELTLKYGPDVLAKSQALFAKGTPTLADWQAMAVSWEKSPEDYLYETPGA